MPRTETRSPIPTRARPRTALGASLALLAAVALAAGSMLAAAPLAVAQDAQDGEPPHPVHIHTGTCAELGDVTVPLDNIVAVASDERGGSDQAIPVLASQTEVEIPLAVILDGTFAINAHRSAEQIDDYIACGDVGGPIVDGRVLMGLNEQNGSGYRGVVLLEEDGDETEVAVYLLPAAASGAEPGAGDTPVPPTAVAADAETPAAAEATEAPAPTDEPAAAAPAGEEVVVDISEFQFAPGEIEVAVGDTVTWTNVGAVPHTSTAVDRDTGWQSEAIPPDGGSFSVTFDEAGEFPYFCEFHPNMEGTIVVG